MSATGLERTSRHEKEDVYSNKKDIEIGRLGQNLTYSAGKLAFIVSVVMVGFTIVGGSLIGINALLSVDWVKIGWLDTSLLVYPLGAFMIFVSSYMSIHGEAFRKSAVDDLISGDWVSKALSILVSIGITALFIFVNIKAITETQNYLMTVQYKYRLSEDNVVSESNKIDRSNKSMERKEKLIEQKEKLIEDEIKKTNEYVSKFNPSKYRTLIKKAKEKSKNVVESLNDEIKVLGDEIDSESLKANSYDDARTINIKNNQESFKQRVTNATAERYATLTAIIGELLLFFFHLVGSIYHRINANRKGKPTVNKDIYKTKNHGNIEKHIKSKDTKMQDVIEGKFKPL